MKRLGLALAFVLVGSSAFAQSQGTLNLQGPSSTPPAPQITTVEQINGPVNAALAAKQDYVGPLLSPTGSGSGLTGLTWGQLSGTPTTIGGYGITAIPWANVTGAPAILSPTGNGGSLTGLAYSQLPALSANQLLGALTATTPRGLSLPSCSGAANALTWTTGTGFGCNSISGAGITVPNAPLLSGDGTLLHSVTAISAVPISGAAGAFTTLGATGLTTTAGITDSGGINSTSGFSVSGKALGFGLPGFTANLGAGGVTALTDGTNTANFMFALPALGNPDNELVITSNIANGNTLAVRNMNPGGFSAYTFRDQFNNEVGSIYDPNTQEAVVVGGITGSVFTVSAVTSGNVTVGDTVAGASSGTYIVSPGTGTGGTGTYNINQSQTVAAGTTFQLMAGGINFESSCLFAGTHPCAQPPVTDFRQTFSGGFVHFIQVDNASTIHLAGGGNCGGGLSDIATIYRNGTLNPGMVVCGGSLNAGEVFQVSGGGSAFTRSGTAGINGANAAAADIYVGSTTAPTLRFGHPSVRKMDIIENTTPNRLDFQDTDAGGTLIPFSIALDGTLTTTDGGPVRYTGAVSSAPTTGGTVTFATTQRLAFLVPAGTLAALTVQLPACAAANDGDERSFLTTQALTALTISAAAGSIGNGAATTATAGSGHAYHCLGSAATWYQMS
jgi:hypothetical protein